METMMKQAKIDFDLTDAKGNSDQFLDVHELKKLLKKVYEELGLIDENELTTDEVKNIMTNYDANKDNLLTVEEYTLMYQDLVKKMVEKNPDKFC